MSSFSSSSRRNQTQRRARQSKEKEESSRRSSSSVMMLIAALLCLLTTLAAWRPFVAVSAFQQPISTSTSSASARGIISQRRERFTTAASSLSSPSSRSTALFAYKPPKKTAPNKAGEFELQELKVNLDSMRRQGVASRNLMPEKRAELQAYAATVCQNMDSPVPLTQLDQALPGTRWRLQFSTQGATMGDLPPDATITLTFDKDLTVQKLDYALEFSAKTLGLNAIKATSKYTVGRDGLKDAGLVTFVYDEIKTDAFGLQNLPTGFFGMLKGRANYIESVFMDDQVWIERGYNSPEGGGEPYYNVYVKDEEEWTS